MFLIYLIIKNKQYAHKNKWKSNHHNNPKTHPNRAIHIVIMNINQRSQDQTNSNKYDPADELPLPCHKKDCEKNKGRHKMH